MSCGNSSSITILPALRVESATATDRLNAHITSLYETHRDGLYRFLVRYNLPSAVAQEVTQDVFLKLLLALRDGHAIGSEQSWLYGVAAKAAVDYWRREGRRAFREFDCAGGAAETFRSQDPTPELQSARREQIRRVAQTMAALPAEQRLCVELRSKGLRYREIAAILGVAISTVSEWLGQAVKRLRASAYD